jgi:hypothetical protein
MLKWKAIRRRRCCCNAKWNKMHAGRVIDALLSTFFINFEKETNQNIYF